MSHAQFVEVMAVASALNTLSVVVGILINNSKLGDFNARLSDTNAGLSESNATLSGAMKELRDHMDTRFDEMRDFWRSQPSRWPPT